MRKLGEVQRDVLCALATHHGWPGGWEWNNASRTAKILDSLVRRKLVKICKPKGGNLYGRYTIAPAGMALLEKTSYGYKYIGDK